MSSLYELKDDYLYLQNLMENPEVDEQTIRDTMEGIEGELEIKAEAYAKVILNIESDISVIKSEEKRLADRRKTLENNIKRMKEALQYVMEMTGKTKFKTELFSFNVQNNPASVVMDEQYIENIPEEYLIPQEPKIDRNKIKDAIKAGKDLGGIAHLEQTQSLRIR